MNPIKNILNKYKNELKAIDQYESLTRYSYWITNEQFIIRQDQYKDFLDDKPNDEIKPTFDELCNDLHEKCKWISIDEYAKNVQKPVEEIEKSIGDGELHAVFKGNIFRIIWPPEYQKCPVEKLYELLENEIEIFSDEMQAIIDEENNSEDAKKRNEDFLKLLERENKDLHENNMDILMNSITQLGKYKNIFTDSEYKLQSSCFVLKWIAFEEFISSTILTLYKLFPEKVIKNKKYNEEKLTMGDIYKFSRQFKNIEDLSEKILNILLSKEEQSKEGINSRIIFLKDNFLNIDPYEAPIIVDFKNTFTRQMDVEEYREVRNKIVHENSIATEEFCMKYPKVPTKNGKIIVTNRYLEVSSKKMKAIAYHIYNSLKDYK